MYALRAYESALASVCVKFGNIAANILNMACAHTHTHTHAKKWKIIKATKQSRRPCVCRCMSVCVCKAKTGRKYEKWKCKRVCRARTYIRRSTHTHTHTQTGRQATKWKKCSTKWKQKYVAGGRKATKRAPRTYYERSAKVDERATSPSLTLFLCVKSAERKLYAFCCCLEQT